MNTITGTIDQFIKQGLTFNNVLLDAPMLSVLTRIGEGTIAKKVSKIRTSAGKGKPAIVWELTLNGSFTIAAKD